jgi:hypothetical protein
MSLLPHMFMTLLQHMFFASPHVYRTCQAVEIQAVVIQAVIHLLQKIKTAEKTG